MFNPISETLSEMLGMEKVAYRDGGLPKHLRHLAQNNPSLANTMFGDINARPVAEPKWYKAMQAMEADKAMKQRAAKALRFLK